MPKSVVPSIHEVAFNCPHCGAFTTQTWFELSANRRSDESRTPNVIDREAVERLRSNDNLSAARESLLPFFEKAASGLVFLDDLKGGKYAASDVHNLHVSRCFACNEISVWIYDHVVFPGGSEAPTPNSDLPETVRLDYDEAGRILNLSPRGAAALLRLAIQKLCASLGEKGKDIDDDIANLVKKGLSPLVQKALDVVRVIGNEAVHPGVLNLKDDRETAARLFELVNIIAEQMISNPKHVEELYLKLPETKRQAIDKRDAPAKESSPGQRGA